MMGLHRRGRALRHFRIERVPRILDDGDAAGAQDLVEPGNAVAAGAAQHDADHARPKELRRRAEQRIDGRAGEMLARSARQPDMAALDQHVPVWRRGIDPAGPDRLAILSVGRRQRGGALQQFRQAASVRPDVRNDQDAAGEVASKSAGDVKDRGEGSRGTADRDDVAASLLFPV